MKETAPEKIYVEISHPFGKDEYTQMVGFEDKVNSDDVEYVRADTFIEKACEWLKEQEEMVGVSFEEDFLERFKEYMKGE